MEPGVLPPGRRHLSLADPRERLGHAWRREPSGATADIVRSSRSWKSRPGSPAHTSCAASRQATAQPASAAAPALPDRVRQVRVEASRHDRREQRLPLSLPLQQRRADGRLPEHDQDLTRPVRVGLLQDDHLVEGGSQGRPRPLVGRVAAPARRGHGPRSREAARAAARPCRRSSGRSCGSTCRPPGRSGPRSSPRTPARRTAPRRGVRPRPSRPDGSAPAGSGYRSRRPRYGLRVLLRQ